MKGKIKRSIIFIAYFIHEGKITESIINRQIRAKWFNAIVLLMECTFQQLHSWIK